MSALYLALIALPFVMMAALGVLLPLLAVVMHRRLGVGLLAIFGIAVVDAIWPALPAMRLGINVFLPDLVLGGVAVVAALRFVMPPAQPGPGGAAGAGGRQAWAFWLLVAVVSVNLVQGLMEFKGAAGAAARPTFYALAACAYVLSFPMDAPRLALLFRASGWAGAALLGLVAWRWMAVAFDIRELLPEAGSFQPQGHSIWRVVASGESLLLAEVALALWFFSALGRTAGLAGTGLAKLGLAGAGLASAGLAGPRLAALALLAVTLALQHRSVWLGLMGGMLLCLWHPGDAKQRFSAWLLPVLAACAVLVAFMLANPERGGGVAAPAGDVASDIATSTRDAVALRGTAADRLSSWRQLIERWAGGGPRVLALGVPFGTSMERFTSDELSARKIAYQPHNYFVEVLVSHGVIGLAAFLAILGTAARGLWHARRHPSLRLPAHWLLAMLACQSVYYLTYGIDFMQSVLLGAALSLGLSLRAQPPPAAAQPGSAQARRAMR